MPGAVVVGTGFGCITHVESLRRAGFDVVALVGRDEKRTAERAAAVGVAKPMTSLADALALPDADVVVIATPPHTHAPLTLQAIAANKHVVCEKPFTLNLAEAQQLQQAAERAGVLNMLGTEFRWGTVQALAARAITEGAIGTPRLATFIMQLPLLAGPDAEAPDWFSDASQGGGWLGAYAPHVIDQIRVTLGEFDGVSAALPVVSGRDWTAEDSFSVRFRTTSGAEGVLQSSVADIGPPVHLTRIVGTGGSLWIDGPDVKVADANGIRTLPVPDDLVLPPRETPPWAARRTAYDRMVSSGSEIGPATRMYEALRALIEGTPPPPLAPVPATFADGVANMAVIDAIRESAANNSTWVPIPSGLVSG
jgi:predicted dehydrogenase